MGKTADDNDPAATGPRGGEASDREGGPVDRWTEMSRLPERRGQPVRNEDLHEGTRDRSLPLTPGEKEWISKAFGGERYEHDQGQGEPVPDPGEQRLPEEAPPRQPFERLSLSARAELRTHAAAVAVPYTDQDMDAIDGGRYSSAPYGSELITPERIRINIAIAMAEMEHAFLAGLARDVSRETASDPEASSDPDVPPSP